MLFYYVVRTYECKSLSKIMLFFLDESIPKNPVFSYDGIGICVNDEHPSKTLFPIFVTEEGIDICFNDEHPQKT